MNQYDVGMQQDFDNMTHELGSVISIAPRLLMKNYDGSENVYLLTFGMDGIGFPILFSASPIYVEEVAFVQPLKENHEVVQSGQLDVGDIKCIFKSDSSASEEDTVLFMGEQYKLQNVTIVRGLSNDAIAYIKAFGKKLPNR